jgi:hypothetical protein
MLAAKTSPIQQSQGDHQEGEGSSSRNRLKGSNSRTKSGPFVPKFAKLNFSRYNGTKDPTDWICRAEQFFEYQNTVEEGKVSLAAFHLEGEAQLWYQLLKESDTAVEWEALKEGLHVRYEPTQFDDFFGNLTKLRQTRTVCDYQSEYERLLSKAGRLSVAQ